MTIFLDSGIFIAFLNKKDVNHGRAKNLIKKIVKKEFGLAISSDYIFDEAVTATLIRTKKLEFALKVGELILGINQDFPNIVKLIYISREIFLDAWKKFIKYKEKRLSFTDATVVSLMENHKIDYLCSFDSNFDGIVNRVY
ncbi:MAG: type II toxin-antitoxin system VapC family toxin [Candidatus Helarchaeota archaeon]